MRTSTTQSLAPRSWRSSLKRLEGHQWSLANYARRPFKMLVTISSWPRHVRSSNRRLIVSAGASKVLGGGTIFAPMDAAFESPSKKMGLESVEDLLDDKNVRSLADVFEYHGELICFHLISSICIEGTVSCVSTPPTPSCAKFISRISNIYLSVRESKNELHRH